MPPRDFFLPTRPLAVTPQDRPSPQDAPLPQRAAVNRWWSRGRLLAAVASALLLLSGGAAIGTAIADQSQADQPAVQQVGQFGQAGQGSNDLDHDATGADNDGPGSA